MEAGEAVEAAHYIFIISRKLSLMSLNLMIRVLRNTVKKNAICDNNKWQNLLTTARCSTRYIPIISHSSKRNHVAFFVPIKIYLINESSLDKCESFQ